MPRTENVQCKEFCRNKQTNGDCKTEDKKIKRERERERERDR